MYRTALAALMVLQCSLAFGQSPAGPPVSKGDQSRAEAEIRQILNDLAVGQRSKADAKELERLYADEFTSVNASGQVQNKAAIIAARVSGRISAQSYELEEVETQIYGDIAIAKTSSRIEGKTARGRFRHLRVFIKRDGRWQIIATQMTKIAEQ
jgi:ketosteroid isomerase-like protein